MRFSYTGLTHRGMVRLENQDAIYLPREGCRLPCLFLVADGMGGANGGKTASEAAVRIIPEIFLQQWPVANPARALRSAVEQANTEIFKQANADPRLHGMGTTLVGLAVLQDQSVLIVNVGDSRCYLFRSNELRQVSQDHSMVQEMVRDGVLTEKQAPRHELRNVLTRALGVAESIEADIFPIGNVYPNDFFMLCSDGLHGLVPSSKIHAILSGSEDIAEKARQLIQEANANGGRDNISVVLVRINQGEYAPDPDEITLDNGGTAKELAPQNSLRSRFGFLNRLLGK